MEKTAKKLEVKNDVKNDGKMATNDIIKKLPQIVSPSILSRYYGMNDGGKLIRRHLRKNFAVENAHEFNNKWTWINDGKNDKLNNVINYLNERYTFTDIKTS